MFDYSTLRGRVIEKYNNQGAFAKAMGLSEHSMSRKFTGSSVWTQSEIARACNLLDIDFKDIPLYFFKPNVQFT